MDRKCYVVAAMSCIPKENWEQFVSIIKKEHPEITGVIQTVGANGCVNFGITTTDEQSVKDFTMAIMPARYASALDKPFEGFINEWQ